MTMLGANIKQGLTELWLHYLWKESRFSQVALTTDQNEIIRIHFPGWYNRGWGPDFSEARIRIGDTERYGDVELHLNEVAWNEHRHHQDAAYNRVILHVFVHRSRKKAINFFGQPVPSLCLGEPVFSSFWDQVQAGASRIIRELPGACGLSLTAERYANVQSLIFQAAEYRILRKSEAFREQIHHRPPIEWEQVLYVSLCRSAGYYAYQNVLTQMADRFPYRVVNDFFRMMHRQSRVEILGRWLGWLGLLNSLEPVVVHDDLRREWAAMRQLWQGLGITALSPPLHPGRSSRPQNHPLRRLVGLYYHFQAVQFHGLFKSWLKYLRGCEVCLHQPTWSRKGLFESLDAMFPQPDWEPLNRLISVSSQRRRLTPSRLIGPSKQMIILVNTVIPFFLAWARDQGDHQLEKTLLALFMVLPAEGNNQKTRFMEQRLLKGHSGFQIQKNLSYHQGLIQLHDDCCTSFYEGCSQCSLLRMLQTPLKSGAMDYHQPEDRDTVPEQNR